MRGAEGANKLFVNLSGKRTLAGRTSGECFVNETTKEDSLFIQGKLSGSRTENNFYKLFSVFFYGNP